MLDRRKKREYRKHKRSRKYVELKHEYETLFKKTSKNYFDNVIKNLLTAKPSQAYHFLKKLGARPGDSEEQGTFSLPTHVDQERGEEGPSSSRSTEIDRDNIFHFL